MALLLLAFGCRSPGEEVAPLVPLVPSVEGVALRNPQDCVEQFDPDRDYFPDRTAPVHAEGFSVRYHGHYKVVSLANPWDDGVDHRYVLVQCGTPVPPLEDGDQVIQVPAPTVITTSTTELPSIVTLGLVDRLIGHTTFAYVTSAPIRERIASGAMTEVGSTGGLDVERVIVSAPGVLLGDTLGHPEFDAGGALGRLGRAGVPVAIVPSFLEPTLLARAEWIKYVALFFNREAWAEAAFDEVERHYRELASIGRAASPKPTAFTGGPEGDTWYMPGGRSWAATLLADAGFDYLWHDDDRTGGVPLAFEVVVHRAQGADWWLQPSHWRSREEIVAVDARLSVFQALDAGRVVSHDARLGPGGGNDYWENGSARPDLVLADLLHVAHPDRLPDHRLVFHRVFGPDD